MVFKIGLLINPISGMGGKVGLKGTDGVYKQALDLGAEKIAEKKASDAIKKFIFKYKPTRKIKWYTCSGEMGYNVLKNNKIENIEIIYVTKKENTNGKDTKNACRKFLEKNVDLIYFCGGDGTTRDIFEVVKDKVPILGIPSGVKMHSGVFAINSSAAAKVLNEFINKSLTVGEAEIMDLDEKKYRKGIWHVRLFGIAKGIVEPTYVQLGKASFQSVSDDYIKDELAEHLEEQLKENKNYLYIFGPGGTIDYIADKLDFKNTILGIDAIYNNTVVGTDLNEQDLLKLLKKYPKAKVILSPIGAQGFILGRGNLQLSPKVIRNIGLDNIIVVSTPTKLKSTPILRVDTGDKKLDKLFFEKEFIMVVIGYRLSRVVKLQTNKL